MRASCSLRAPPQQATRRRRRCTPLLCAAISSRYPRTAVPHPTPSPAWPALHWTPPVSTWQVRALLGSGSSARGTDAPSGYVGPPPLWLACTGGHEECVDELLRANADANTVLHKGRSVLLAACRRGHASCARRVRVHANRTGTRRHHISCTTGPHTTAPWGPTPPHHGTPHHHRVPCCARGASAVARRTGEHQPH
jgi:hypothetical protein